MPLLCRNRRLELRLAPCWMAGRQASLDWLMPLPTIWPEWLLFPGLEGLAGDDNTKRKKNEAGLAAKTGDVPVRLADAERDGHDRPETDKAVTGSNRQDSLLSVGGDFMVEGQSAGSPTNGFWGDADLLFCRDGKWRPVEPGLEPLAHRPAARMGRLRAYGNAIVPQAAAVFIRACM